MADRQTQFAVPPLAERTARWYEFRFRTTRWSRMETTPWGFDVRVVVLGWWLRFIWGVTFRPERFRYREFYGYRLAAVRLWGSPNDSRLIGFQWRRAERNPLGRLTA